MADMDAALDRYQEIETGEAFSLQGPRLLKVELSETSVMARNGSMVAYQGEVSFEHKVGLSRGPSATQAPSATTARNTAALAVSACPAP